MKVAFYPEFSDAESLSDHYYRLHWYLFPFRMQIENIVMPVASDALAIGQLPPYLDESISRLAGALPVAQRRTRNESELRSLIEEADRILIWSVDSKKSRARIPGLNGKLATRVDHQRMARAGSHYLMFPPPSPILHEQFLAQSKAVFASIVDRCKAEVGYIFGTGPNLSMAFEHDFSDGICIACNSMVRNHALLERLNPKIIAIADPIFHAGPSRYAGEFRKELVRALDLYDAHLVVPLRDFHIYRHHLPMRFAERISAIPFQRAEEPNLDLSASFHVTTTENILTLFLLPLASTLFNDIRIFGCDGRPLGENAYFWSHDKASQFNDEMSGIKLAHPAFFSIDYEDYYSRHCDTLEKWMSSAESRGKRFSNWTPSFIPALQARSRSKGALAEAALADRPQDSTSKPYRDRLLVSIDPDGVDESGHFLAYDKRISEACAELGTDFAMIGRSDLRREILPPDLRVTRGLSIHSWEMAIREDGKPSPRTSKFAEELGALVSKEFADSGAHIILYMYCGSLDHAAAIQKVIAPFNHIRANVNLFWQSFAKYDLPRYVNRWRPQVWALCDDPRMTLTVPTIGVQEEMERHFGVRLPIAPHPSTTFSDAAARALSLEAPHQLPSRPTILFPGSLRKEKGLELAVHVVSRLAHSERTEVKIRVKPDTLRGDLRRIIHSLPQPDKIVVDRDLEEEDFISFLKSGDIIVCPYLSPQFKARTSGLLIDSMLLGRPVVALRRTWLGDFVTSTGIGVIADPHPDSLVGAIDRVLQDYPRYAEAAAEARKLYLSTQSWSSLARSVLCDATAGDDQHKDACATIEERDRLIAKLPANLRAPIFLPTDRMPLEGQVRGLARVVRMYDQDLDRVHRPRIRALKARPRGKRCFVIGNGPSLKHIDLAFLKAETTFATNGFFLMMPELSWTPTFYVVEDHLVAEDRAAELNRLRGPIKLFPASLSYVLDDSEDTIFFDHRPRKKYPDGFDFSFDADINTYAGGTVTFTCIQLAAYLGFEEIYLIGVDANYSIPQDASLSGSGRVKEIDMQSDDPNHFHPDYFGKGKRWHQPNVNVMLGAYAEAKRACDARGVKIFNATSGGRLEVFPRVPYNSLFRRRTQLPRLLLIDQTRIGDGTATGELKSVLFADWPSEKLLQIFDAGEARLGFFQDDQVHTVAGDSANAGEIARKRVAMFRPELIVYRPVPRTALLHNLAMRILEANPEAPAIAWIMDDWPAFASGDVRIGALERDWRALLKRSRARFAISEKMAFEFQARYGCDFQVYANGVDPTHWRAPNLSAQRPVRIRYAGSLAENMTLWSLLAIAECVEKLASAGADILFEIKTRELWRDAAAIHFEKLNHTTFVTSNLSPGRYREWLAGADILVIAYNFDEESKQYVRYSLANKLPECLASGAALLAVGPREVATMEILEKYECGVRITSFDAAEIARAIADLAASPEKRLYLGRHAQRIAFENFSITAVRMAFQNAIVRAADGGALELNEYRREAQAHVDETGVVARLLRSRQGRRHLMIDVGAHFGTSAAYFRKLDWTVICFEPDANNRARLEARFGADSAVTIDPRAVSDQKSKAAAFFTSDESTGISGLHGFRHTHRESARVEVTTIADVILEKNIDRVDFLKIDVEGFDLAVLRGVPWDTLEPHVIECEFEDAKTLSLGHRWRDIAEFLQEKGYVVYVSEWHPIVRYGAPHDWRRLFRYPDGDVAEGAWGNLLAFRADPGLSQIRDAFQALMKFRKDGAAAPKKSSVSIADKPVIGSTGGKLRAIADGLRGRSPRLYSILRFSKRTAAQIWRRRGWTLPVAFIFLGSFVATFHSVFDPIRLFLWSMAFAGAIAVSVCYLGYRLHMFAERMASENAEIRARLDVSDRKIAALQKRSAALDAQLTQMRDDQSARRRANASNSKRMKEKLEAAAARQAAIEARLKKTEGRAAAALNLAKSAAAEIGPRMIRAEGRAAAALKLARAVPPNNAIFYQQFNRQLTRDQIAQLTETWNARLSVDLSASMFGYFAARICAIESMCEGRLAASVEDMLLRVAAASAVKRESLELLEIGSLFGISAAILYEALSPRHQTMRMTLIDPFEGYYEANQHDPHTGQPVTEAAVRRNLSRACVPGEAVRIIKALSTSETAIRQAASRRYDVLLIDGDHSYAGVKFDFEHYAPFVSPGGFIIFDDYTSPFWPDVTRYLDEEVRPRADFKFIGASWRTAIFQLAENSDSNPLASDESRV